MMKHNNYLQNYKKNYSLKKYLQEKLIKREFIILVSLFFFLIKKFWMNIISVLESDNEEKFYSKKKN